MPFKVVLICLLMVSLVACDQAPPALPTTVAPIEVTEQAVTTEPPTATIRPTTQRATLPPVPTATLSPTPTETPQPPFSEATSVPITPIEPLSVCETFVVDFARTAEQFTLGNAPNVYWQPVEGAVGYRVRVYNVRNSAAELTEQALFTAETSFQFDAALFESGEGYGWEVYPIDAAQQQMCFAIGGALIPVG